MKLKPSLFRSVFLDYVSRHAELDASACAYMNILVQAPLKYILKKLSKVPEGSVQPYEKLCVWAHRYISKTDGVIGTDAVAYMEKYVIRAGYASRDDAPLTEKAQTSVPVGQVIVAMEKAVAVLRGNGDEDVRMDENGMIACAALVEFIIREVTGLAYNVACEASSYSSREEDVLVTARHIHAALQEHPAWKTILGS